MLKSYGQCISDPTWNNRWSTIFLPKQIKEQGKREKCNLCNGIFGNRVPHYPCDENKVLGGNEMPISDEEFDGLNGTPKGGFKLDADSLTQRVLSGLQEGTAYSVEEVMEVIDLKEGEDSKKVKGVLNNLTRVVGKRAARLEKKYNSESVPYFRKVKEGGETVVEVLEPEVESEETVEDVDAEE